MSENLEKIKKAILDVQPQMKGGRVAELSTTIEKALKHIAKTTKREKLLNAATDCFCDHVYGGGKISAINVPTMAFNRAENSLAAVKVKKAKPVAGEEEE